MSLAIELRPALAADIDADPAFAAIPNTPDGSLQIAQAYNLLANPDFYVWRSNVSTAEVRDVLVWAEYDALSVSKQNAFEFLCSNGIINPSRVNVRQGISSIFGSPQQSQTRDALINIGRRLATRAEKLFADGDGTEGSPAIMVFEGQLTWQDVHNARNL